MRIELLYCEGCPNYRELLTTLRETLARAGISDQIELRPVESIEEAEHERFLGSPTVRVDDRDVDPTASERRDYGIKCRLYRDSGASSGVPPKRWIAAAIDDARAREMESKEDRVNP